MSVHFILCHGDTFLLGSPEQLSSAVNTGSSSSLSVLCDLLDLMAEKL